MELILDGKNYNEIYEIEEIKGVNEDNIMEVLKDYISWINKEGRHLRYFYLDGKNVPELVTNPENILAFLKEAEVEKIELVSVAQGDIINETISSVVDYLDKLISYTEELSRSIQAGTIPDKDSIIQLTDSLEWVYQATNGLIISLKDADLKDKVDDLQDVFGQIIYALRKDDYSSLGNILEHELTEKLEALKSLLDNILSERKT